MFEEDDDEEMRDPRSLPIYKKGEEIYDLTRQVADLIPDDNEMLESTKGFMLEDASMICAKIAGAEGGDIGVVLVPIHRPARRGKAACVDSASACVRAQGQPALKRQQARELVMAVY